MSSTSRVIRIMFKQTDDKRDENLKTPEDIIRYDNIQYGDDPIWQSLDVYRPKQNGGDKLPVIVNVHGGAWVYGTKETYQFYCMNLAQRGFAVVNFTYRLAPESRFPACIEDTNLVFQWVLGHALDYDFDTNRIFAVGDSAGAHILSLYTAICTNSNYAKKFSFQVPQDFVPKAIALNCGEYTMEEIGVGSQLIQQAIKELFKEQGTKEEIELANVLKYVTSAFPPTYIMTSTNDFLREQAPLMVNKLTSCNVPFVYRIYGDEEHMLGHVFHLDIRTEEAKLCNDEQCRFFKELTP